MAIGQASSTNRDIFQTMNTLSSLFYLFLSVKSCTREKKRRPQGHQESLNRRIFADVIVYIFAH